MNRVNSIGTEGKKTLNIPGVITAQGIIKYYPTPLQEQQIIVFWNQVCEENMLSKSIKSTLVVLYLWLLLATQTIYLPPQ